MHVSFKIFLIICVCFSNVISSPVPEDVDIVNTARIVNGFEVNIADIPYQASLRKRVLAGYAHICGAVIITSRGLLTAAHCVVSSVQSPSTLQVTVGTANRIIGGTAYDISLVIPHEQYSTATLEHDIALLVTTKLIDYSQTVQPITIADKDMELPNGLDALVSGFGTTSYEGSSSNVLLAARVYIVARDTCARAYLRIAAITTGMLCANASSPPRDACQGDSGGPLVSRNRLIGIVSWGEGCADTSYPGVYTKVAEYHAWIGQKMAALY